MKQETKCYCGHTTYCDCGPLEEASWKYNPLKKLDGEFLRQAFKEGAKWQQEQDKKQKCHKSFLFYDKNVQKEKKYVALIAQLDRAKVF